MINGHAFRTYNYLLAKGVAKELARTILPVGAYTEFYATCNARSLMHFVALRNDTNAQYEIRVAAEAVENIFGTIMPVTHAAFIENGRVAP
jgi:thymidylate synthase (FAD)